QTQRRADRAAAAAERFETIKAEFRATWDLRVADFNARVDARETARAALELDRMAISLALKAERATVHGEQAAQRERALREAHEATMARVEARRQELEALYQARKEYWAKQRADRDAAKQARWLARPINWKRLNGPRGGYVKMQRAPAEDAQRPTC
ncbi:MAG: hypothetical protein WAP47_03510, partial [Candidatus Rokuibacteriota bacterium]